MRKHRAGGFILTTMAVTSAVPIACIGLGIDAGYLELIKVRMQSSRASAQGARR